MCRLLVNFILVLLLIPIGAQALDSDAKEKIMIEADSAELDQKKQQSIFRGKVKIDQGSTHIQCDELILYFDNHENIKSAVAKGNLAHYQTQPEPGKPNFHARAQEIRYNLQTHEIELSGLAHANQGDNHFSGPHILYNMKSQTILSAKKANGRTTIVLDPQSDYWRLPRQ